MNAGTQDQDTGSDASLARRDRRLALFISVIPPLFILALYIINRPYLMQFFNPQTRACGMPIFVLIFVLVLAAYPSLLGSLSLIRSGRRAPGTALAFVVILVFVFPASLLVLLGPAALLLLTSPLGGILR